MLVRNPVVNNIWKMFYINHNALKIGNTHMVLTFDLTSKLPAPPTCAEQYVMENDVRRQPPSSRKSKMRACEFYLPTDTCVHS